MKQKLSLVLYILLAFLMLLAFYLIFNVGNPDSLLRYIVPTTDYDIAVTLGVSICIAFLSFYVFRDRKENPAVAMLEQNRDHINGLRQEGRSDSQIADSFLQELKPNYFKRKKTRKLVLKTLERMEK